MRHKYLFSKIALVAFAFSTTACSFKLNPVSDLPSVSPSTVHALETAVESYSDDSFKSSAYAEMMIDDLKDESESYGYELEKAILVRVVDGDTLIVDYNGEETKVRLIGVNTPESVASQEYLDYKGTTNSEEGKNASDWVKALLSEHTEVYLQKDTSDIDRYGRTLRYVWLDVPTDTKDIEQIRTKMLNGMLLDQGLAEVAIYKPDVEYADEFQAIYTHTTDEFVSDEEIDM